MTTTVIRIVGSFTGLYDRGKGFRSDAIAARWNTFWWNVNTRSIFWKYFRCGDSQYLVGQNGSICLHPLRFNAVIHSDGGRDLFMEINELHRLCDECAVTCGGQFELKIKGREIDL